MKRESQDRGVLAWFAGNHVAANLLMVFLLATGVLSLMLIRVEVFQEIDPDLIQVQVPYPGASPSEVEESICQRVEEAIKGIEGIKKVRSVANESMGLVNAELEDYADDREVLDDVKTAVDRIEDFPPQDAEEPVVVDTDARIQVISLAVYGDVPERTIKELADEIRDDLTAMEKISLVEVEGVRRYEVSIEVSEEKLRRHGLSFQQVSEAVGGSSLDLPGGSVKTSGGEILIRTKGQRYVGQDFEDIVLLTRPDGTQLYLSDVATVLDGFEDSDQATYFDGKPAAFLKVYRVGNQGALGIEEIVKEYEASKRLPEGVQIANWFNRGEFLRGRVELLVRNALLGLCLVFLCLTLFLDLRLAFWTTMGIPISFLGGFCLMPIFGVSVNMISLFALIVVLGIVVDDAIVVGENVFAYRQKGLSGYKAAVRGVRELAAPVTIAVLTTMAAFMPLRYTEGQLGKILWPVPVVVVCVLIMSLVDALLILPAHLSTRGLSRAKPGPIARVQAWFRGGMQWVVDHPYTWLLKRAISWRYLTVAIAVALFVATLGFVAGGHIKFLFLPETDADRMWAVLVMPQGTPVEETRKVVSYLEDSVLRLRDTLDAEREPDEPSVLKHISTTIGALPFDQMAGGGPTAAVASSVSRSHLAEVDVELVSGEYRRITSMQLANRWRETVGEVPGVSSLVFRAELFSAGEAVNVELAHQDFDTLLRAADDLKRKLSDFSGVSDIVDSFEAGKVELKLTLTDLGRASGLRLGDLARQVRQGFYGDEVQRIQRGRDDIKVMVRYPEAERRSTADIENMRIRLPDGTEMPFRLVANVEEGRGYAEINRTDRRRVVSVTASVDDEIANPNEINETLRKDVLPALKDDYAGLYYQFEGEQLEQQKSIDSMIRNMGLALLVIFCLLGVQFRSYAQPLIVMSAIPFGLIGAVIGHVIMGMDLTMLSFFGVVALTGVVVNDSLVMIDLVNRLRRQGLPRDEVLLISGTRRFRPIVLTTATTFLGLTPMILERSLQAKFLIPMAVSLGFGVVFATSITLLLVPALCRILDDFKEGLGFEEEPEESEADAIEEPVAAGV